MGVEKSSQLALVFKYFGQFMGQALFGHFLGGSTITIITPNVAHVPGQHMWPQSAHRCGQILAQGPTPSVPKQLKSDVHMFRVKILSAQDVHVKS